MILRNYLEFMEYNSRVLYTYVRAMPIISARMKSSRWTAYDDLRSESARVSDDKLVPRKIWDFLNKRRRG